MSDATAPNREDDARPGETIRGRLLLAFSALAILLSFGCCFGAGWLLGWGQGVQGKYNEQYHRERELVEPILANDPAFAQVEIRLRSNGGIYLLGEVPTPRDSARLQESVARVVGEPRAKEIMVGVSPHPDAAQTPHR